MTADERLADGADQPRIFPVEPQPASARTADGRGRQYRQQHARGPVRPPQNRNTRPACAFTITGRNPIVSAFSRSVATNSGAPSTSNRKSYSRK
jgi:hypothetical protein